MIIGITGTICSGKGKAAEILVALGFKRHSFSLVIREIAKERGIEINRENLSKLGQDLRKESPQKSLLAERIIRLINKDKAAGDNHFVVEGIRDDLEIGDLKKEFPEFALIAIDAPQKLRFDRLKKRGRHGDPQTFSDFEKIDDAELFGTGGQEVGKCIDLAEYVLENSSTEKELEKKLLHVIANLT